MTKSAKNTRPEVLLITRCLIKKDNKILLIKRADSNTWEPERWEIPGGKVDIGQDLSQALEREVLEETDLYVKATSNTVFSESYMVSQGKYKNLPYVVIVYRGAIVGGSSVRIDKDHTEYAWCSHKGALKKDLTVESRKAILALEEIDKQ